MKSPCAAALGVALALAGVGSAPAQTPELSSSGAHAEFCAAALLYWPESPASREGRSKGIAFGFRAPVARTVDGATMVADTDGGWYTWSVRGVTINREIRGDYFSNPQVATFDEPVVVRHAWVTSAQGVACGIPAFGDSVTTLANPLLTRGWPEVAAERIPAPYDTNCTQPFAEASVEHVAQPDYPRELYPGHYASQILVRVGDRDNLIDASVYKPSVNDEINANALKAARASTYRSAVSYCRKTTGAYLFKADFEP